jgi:ADP-ribose/FAD diphosphatase
MRADARVSSERPPMKFCPQCGAPLARRVPPGDDRERAVCTACDLVHFENPKVVAGCLVEHEGGLLLCRRAIEPQGGLWTVPAGFLELREGLVEGARRETREEALADVEILAPHAYLDLPHIGQTYALFRARLRTPERGPRFAPGAESLAVELFDPDELPWDELAFPVVHHALKLWLADRAAGRRHVHLGVVKWNGDGSRFDATNCELLDHLGVPLDGAD